MREGEECYLGQRLHRSLVLNSSPRLCPSSSLQGYKISDDGKAESEDDFQKRMGGVVRLYAAVIQAEVTIFGTELVHPQGLGHGWMWLARVLNGDPHPSITATALCEFLEVWVCCVYTKRVA